MASFTRRRPPAAVWSVDDASTFAALKEFKLLQLLSADKKAFATDGTSPWPLLS
jgi:predicted nucleic acid-binding protein